MAVTLIRSEWVSGNLVFYEDTVGQSVTGDVFTIGTAAVKVGGTSQDVDFQFYATGSKSFIIDAGAGTVTLTGIKLGSQLYANLTGTDYTILKIHNHLTTAAIGGAEFKGEFINPAGDAEDGLAIGTASYWSYAPTGLTGTPVGVSASVNVMALAPSHIITTGNLYALSGEAQIQGTLNGAAVNVAGVIGIISGAGATTLCLHMAGVQSAVTVTNPTTGTLSHFLANTVGTGVIDNLICMQDSEYITNFASFNAAATDKCAEENTNAITLTATSYCIRVLIAGNPGYIPVFDAKTWT